MADVSVPTQRSLADSAKLSAVTGLAGAVNEVAIALGARLPAALPGEVVQLGAAVLVGGMFRGEAGDNAASIIAFSAGSNLMRRYGSGILDAAAG